MERLYGFVFAAKRMVKGAATLTSFAIERPLLRQQNKDRLTQIAAQLEEIEAEIYCLIQDNPLLQRRFEILISIPGIGDLTAFVLLAEMPARTVGWQTNGGSGWFSAHGLPIWALDGMCCRSRVLYGGFIGEPL